MGAAQASSSQGLPCLQAIRLERTTQTQAEFPAVDSSGLSPMFSTRAKTTNYLLSDIGYKTARTVLSLILLPPSALALPPTPNLFCKKALAMPKLPVVSVVFPTVCSESVNDKAVDSSLQDFCETPRARLNAKALPLEWLLAPKSETLVDHVLAHLVCAEAHETDPSYRDDIRIAWHIVLISNNGEAVTCTPTVLAWYKVLGCHPDHVWPRIQARRRAMLGEPVSLRMAGAERKAGADLAPQPPIKKAAPVQIPRKEGVA